MTRSLRLPTAIWLGVAMLGLSACGGDVAPTRARTSSPSATVSESRDPATSPATTAAATPTVAPATGIELREQSSSIRVPEGWRAAEPLASYQSGAIGPVGAGSINLIDDETLNPGTPLRVRVKSAIKTLSPGAKFTRLPTVMLGDSVAYHLRYRTPGRTEVSDIIETERNLRLVTINFTLSARALRKNPDLVASVLATFKWRD